MNVKKELTEKEVSESISGSTRQSPTTVRFNRSANFPVSFSQIPAVLLVGASRSDTVREIKQDQQPR
ncbi:hypothetical protein Pcinc_039981 [Petrolisthes cinctipes]|uniref:Uncharacterized protein n=1 Tax=Petrolisthes cinctipes TaxID=88211 RepID=A0AAE1EIJ9_PETCI|nr:hypothetical protein Pcinc_039981 [Petrolisthes cinctipes]